jgi:mono/diheme cytochrome c family protein
MKRIALALAVVALAAPSRAAAADAKEVFSSNCALCHGEDGKGSSKMGKKLGLKDLAGTKLSEAEVETLVTKGKGKMTAFGKTLSAEEVKAVAGFVKGGLK